MNNSLLKAIVSEINHQLVPTNKMIIFNLYHYLVHKDLMYYNYVLQILYL